MITIKNITDKIVKQCQLMYDEIGSVDSDFISSLAQSVKQQDLLHEVTQKPDLALYNNSFVFREDLKTKKSIKYLALSSYPKDERNVFVVSTENSFNRDWILRKPHEDNYPEAVPLIDAVNQNIKDLGEIIYVLIGNIGQPEIVSSKINNKNYKELFFDSNEENVSLEKNCITANPNLTDAGIWRLITQKITLNENERMNLKLSFFQATESLRKQLITPLVLPGENTDLENTLLDEILNSLSSEISDYETSLHKWQDNTDDEVNFNNMLRISYNFSDEAVRIINLIINISDLKPILMWMTIYSQYMLRQEFSKLERQKTDKPSLKEYDQLIKGARNSRFHNMLHIKNTMKVDMDGVSIHAKTMTLFNEFSRNNTSVNFEYEDQKLIEILTTFTRAGEKSVSDEFWEQNLAIMKATCTLINDLCFSLKSLRLLKKGR